MKVRSWVHALAAVAVLTACGGDGAKSPAPSEQELPQRMIDESNVANLPQWQVDTLTTPICVADGYGDCPLRAAWANSLGDGRVAVWEPRRRVLVLAPDGTMMPVGDSVAPLNVAAITGDGRGFQAVVVDDAGWHLANLNREGRETRRVPLPAASSRNIVGFVGRVPVAQRLANMADPAGGRLQVDRLASPTDSSGAPLLDVQIPWLREINGMTVPAPLFTTLPVYTVGEDGAITWSTGQRFEVESRDRDGTPRWRLFGPVAPEITDEEYAIRMSDARERYAALPLAEEDFERMRMQAPTTHPAISALVRSETGIVYVGGAARPAADSVRWFRLSAAGEPTGRFTLSAMTRVLFARNDSLLVHRPTEGEPWEVRWIRLLPPE
jgi:hypothetical protein